MFEQQPPRADYSMQMKSVRPDGKAVVREGSTYMTDVDAEQFCIFFAEGLDAGLGYARIVSFLERKGVKASVVQSLRKSLLEEGAQLSEAFARHGLLDATGRKLVLVAETQGTVPELLKLQSKHYRNRYERKKDIVLSSVEFVIMAIFAFGALIPIVSNVTVLAASRNSLVADVFQIVLGPMIIALFASLAVFLLAYGWLALPVDMPSREMWSRIFMRIPGLSIPGKLFATSVFCRYFYTSVRSGLNIYESIYLAAEACNDPAIFSQIPEALQHLEQGFSLEHSLSTVKAIPRDVIDYVGMGEETGRLEEMLLKCAEIYKERADDATKRAISATIFTLRIVMLVTIVLLAFMSMLDRMSIFTELMGGM